MNPTAGAQGPQMTCICRFSAVRSLIALGALMLLVGGTPVIGGCNNSGADGAAKAVPDIGTPPPADPGGPAAPDLPPSNEGS